MRKLLLAVLMSLGLAHHVHAFGPNPQINPWSEDSGYRIWMRSEYMLWWLRSSPIPPLVTTGTTGILTAPDTQVLLGNNMDLGTFNAGKLSMGYWFDQNGVFGIEGDIFLTEQRGSSFFNANDGTGTNGLFIPFNDVNPILVVPTESAVNVAVPGFTSGAISVTNSARLWGNSADFALTPYRDEFLEVVLLGGFRYLDLEEDFNLYFTNNFFGITSTANDHFGTRNQFYGGELGARATFKFDALFVQLGGKCALGANHQTSVIDGSNFFGFTGLTTPGGVFAQPTNIGTREQNDFSVVPSAQVRVGFDMSTHMRVMIGYDFIYWTDVIRPGTQIDRTINSSQTLGGTLAGDARPAFNFVNTDFFAHGVSFGFEIRF